MMEKEVKVIQLICDKHGCVAHDDLVQMAGVEDVEYVLNNRDLFTVIQQNKSKQILVTTHIRRCRTPAECHETCTQLHLCKYDLLGQCNTPRCKYGHSLKSEHNSRVLREHGLQDLSKDQLCVLLLQNDSSLLPNVCVSYNKGSGEFGNCPDKDACTRLHVCERYIRGQCDGSSECNRCHDFFEPYPSKLLQTRGVASHLIGSLLPIYRNILTLKDHRSARDKPGARSRENPKFSNRAKVPEVLQRRNTENVICLSFIRGKCKYEDNCWRIHIGVPYKWEVEDNKVWIELPDNEVIERDYCDPAKIHSVGTKPVHFESMMQGLRRVRRLSTVSSVSEPSFIHTTKWIWFWEDEYHKWIPFGSIKEMHRLSSIDSEELEKQYLSFLEDNTHDGVRFTAGKQFYELNFRAMKQRNEMSGTERQVRRRPLFVSLADVQTARIRRGPNSGTRTGVPGFWDKTAIPESGFQRVSLNPSHKDYVRVQELFKKTMQEFSILTIERVQNKELWEDFQTKRERMKKANSNKKYGEAEKLLFHRTCMKKVDVICRQNFDIRVTGANATVYGQGIYFSKDAKHSNDYTDRYGERSMFACRVLVGQYTKGEAHYHKPPTKDAEGNLYDSCVNDVHDPSIYVVFKQSQVYPEFLITYEKSRFPKDTDFIESKVNTCSAILNVSRTGSVISTPHNVNTITSGSTSTDKSLTATRIPTTRNLLLAALDSPAKNVSSDTRTYDTKSPHVVLKAPKSEQSINSKPSQDLTTLNSLLKESDQVITIPVFSSSGNMIIGAKNQQEALIDHAFSTLATERRSQSLQQDSQCLEFTKSVTDSLAPSLGPSDKPKIVNASLAMQSKTSVPHTTQCSSVTKQPVFNDFLDPSSENASQKVHSFTGVFNVNQTASGTSSSSSHTTYDTTRSTRTRDESLTSVLSYTGLPKKSTQDLVTSVKVSSYSDNSMLISSEPILTDKSMSSKLRPNRGDLVAQRSQTVSQNPAARSGFVSNTSNPCSSPSIPGPSTSSRNLTSDALITSRHSEKDSKISVMYKYSSDKQPCSDDSLLSSFVSFREMQTSAPSSMQKPLKSPQQAPAHEKKCLLQ